MKKLINFLDTIFPSLTKMVPSLAEFAQRPVDVIGVKGPLVLGNTAFHLAWVSDRQDNYWIQEYLPAGQTIESFNEMLAIHLLETNFGVEEMISQKMYEFDQRKMEDPFCNYQVTQRPNGKDYMIDVIVSVSKDDKLTLAEFTIMKFRQVEMAGGKKGLLIYSNARRSYGDDVIPFLNTLQENRAAYVNAMIAFEISRR